VVFEPLFCDQSMKTFPGRSDFVIRETTSRGRSRSSRSAKDFARSLAWSADSPPIRA
jgi:hypothetical protein